MSGLTVDPNYCSHVPKSDSVGDERPWCVACLRRDNAELKARVAELERERDAAIKERDEARRERDARASPESMGLLISFLKQLQELNDLADKARPVSYARGLSLRDAITDTPNPEK